MLSEDTLKYYLQAGRIASEVRREVKDLVKEGALILQICNSVERGIRRRGGEVAFPCNVCVNEVAAHYSSPPNDGKRIPKGAVVKVDLGVHVEGYIADTATTVSLNPHYKSMVFAVNKALEQAINAIKPRIKINDVAKVVRDTIERYGFKPIRNLSGHQMSRYVLHTGKSIPNVPGFGFQRMSEGEVYAIEPFLTQASGSGLVKNTKEGYIYRFQKVRRLANPRADKLLTAIRSKYRSLPFSFRWIDAGDGGSDVFDELVSKRCVARYNVLVELKGGLVAQAEHTVVVTKDGCVVTTR